MDPLMASQQVAGVTVEAMLIHIRSVSNPVSTTAKLSFGRFENTAGNQDVFQ